MITYSELIKNLNVLIADDDEDYLNMTYEFLHQVGYNVDKVTDGKQALEAMEKKDYQILLLDYFMPLLNGEEVIKEVRKTNKELIIILQTGFSGQKPPIETMQKLNIQNYHDKTEGIDRLNLELISAVKIFNQQNEIELTKYRSNAIGNLISGVAQEIKSNLLTISAGIDVTNLIMQEAELKVDKTTTANLNKFYVKNKESLEKIDKVLTSIIGQTKNNGDYIMADNDIIDIINLIVINEARQKGIELVSKIALKSKSYINGSINDTVFIVCEVLRQLICIEKQGEKVELTLTEDQDSWLFVITCQKVNQISQNDFYLIKKIVLSIEDANISREDNKIVISMNKNII
ncbi:MAG: response regulator [Clostridia bacterium]